MTSIATAKITANIGGGDGGVSVIVGNFGGNAADGMGGIGGMGYKYGEDTARERIYTIGASSFSPPTINRNLNPENMSEYQVMEYTSSGSSYRVFRAPPHPGPEPLRENYSSDSAYNTAHNTWQTKANKYNDYIEKKEHWEELWSEYEEAAISWQSGIHPLLKDTKFNKPLKYATYDGFLIIEYLGPQIDE